MGLYSSINIASSGLTAERLRLDVISNNIANANTTRTAEGGPFRRSRVNFASRSDKPDWKSHFLPKALESDIGKGVRVSSIEKDMRTETRLVYDPGHSDAIKSGPNAGYVEFPNVSIVEEMTDMIAASRAYEANVSVMNGARAMFMKALDIGR
jgi:flagellar basal-body rod protein FlgC